MKYLLLLLTVVATLAIAGTEQKQQTTNRTWLHHYNSQANVQADNARARKKFASQSLRQQEQQPMQRRALRVQRPVRP